MVEYKDFKIEITDGLIATVEAKIADNEVGDITNIKVAGAVFNIEKLNDPEATAVFDWIFAEYQDIYDTLQDMYDCEDFGTGRDVMDDIKADAEDQYLNI